MTRQGLKRTPSFDSIQVCTGEGPAASVIHDQPGALGIFQCFPQAGSKHLLDWLPPLVDDAPLQFDLTAGLVSHVQTQYLDSILVLEAEPNG